MAHILAIDAGTTGVRAIVFDESRAVLGSSYRELTTTYPRPAWVEQDPGHVRDSTLAVIRSALDAADISGGDLDAIGDVATDCSNVDDLLYASAHGYEDAINEVLKTFSV